jgi:hypothetical protein
MRTRKSTIASFNSLYDTDPQLLESVLRALNDELKKVAAPQTRVVSFICPNCDALLGVSMRPNKHNIKRTPAKPRKSNFASGVNKVVLQLAKIRGTMTANIHREFTKLLGSKVNKISKEEYRQKKLAWLRSEIGKSKGRKRTSAA